MATRHNQFVLAVDLGTSGCKCALVGFDGIVHKWAFSPVPLHIVDTIGAEQDPEDWWNAFLAAARELIATLGDDKGEIAAICCSCQGECTVPVDQPGSRFIGRCRGSTCAARRPFAVDRKAGLLSGRLRSLQIGALDPAHWRGAGSFR